VAGVDPSLIDEIVSGTPDAMLRWAADPQPFHTVGACDFENAASDEQALLFGEVRVLIPQTERATSLAELKQLGQKVDALSWTPSQRSAL
jgi:hypothetical protein